MYGEYMDFIAMMLASECGVGCVLWVSYMFLDLRVWGTPNLTKKKCIRSFYQQVQFLGVDQVPFGYIMPS